MRERERASVSVREQDRVREESTGPRQGWRAVGRKPEGARGLFMARFAE